MDVNTRVKLDLDVPIEMDEALRHLAATTGESKRSIVRRATAHELVRAGLLAPTYALAPTPSAGPLGTRQHRETS